MHRSIIPEAIADNLEALGDSGEALRNDPEFSLYRSLEAGGFKVVEAQERISARLADREEAKHLKVKRPAPVMVIFRRSYDATGRLVEAVEAVYLSDFYSYDVRLVASHGVGAEPSGKHLRSPERELTGHGE